MDIEGSIKKLIKNVKKYDEKFAKDTFKLKYMQI
jgi:hypothetical protein